jgi:hypothetical protein
MRQYIRVYTIKCQSQSFQEIFKQDFTEPTMRIGEFDARVAELLRTFQTYRALGDNNRLLMKMARYLVTTLPDSII